MRYKSFRIRNFKGIKDTTINLETVGDAGVFAFVGLNESGKTTILEAIHSFAPDIATSELLGGEEETGVPYAERVPRHQISSFTGDVSIEARLSLTDDDITKIAEIARKRKNIDIDVANFPKEIALERHQRFENGDFKDSFFSLRSEIRTRSSRQKSWRNANAEEKLIIRNSIRNLAPSIAYFPTFIFDFPDKIYLTDRGGRVDAFYRRVFQDILDFDRQGLEIEKDIVRRIRSESMVVPWLSFLSLWPRHDDQAKIQHVMDRAGAVVTQVVFGRWNKIFKEDIRGKEVIISFDIDPGEKVDSKGAKSPTDEHDLYIKFQIRDGTRRFDVNDRSLGFRWFFAFMLFTQFRVARQSSKPLLFLFDEPASNLHAAAQQKLVDCFPEIARNGHMLAYSTHSHYMIEPKWLEQTFIVTNRADAPPSSILDDISLDDESLDIKATPYRTFVNAHPSQTSYFQPIIDRLDVVPSRFDMQRPSIILEGKSNYYILRYASQLLDLQDPPLLPGMGAGTFGALIALHLGWNLRFLFVTDGDEQGQAEQKRYIKEFCLPPGRVVTISELSPTLTVIEDLLDTVALSVIQTHYELHSGPTKSQIRRYFQEKLASSNISKISPEFERRAAQLLEELRRRLL